MDQSCAGNPGNLPESLWGISWIQGTLLKIGPTVLKIWQSYRSTAIPSINPSVSLLRAPPLPVSRTCFHPNDPSTTVTTSSIDVSMIYPTNTDPTRPVGCSQVLWFSQNFSGPARSASILMRPEVCGLALAGTVVEADWRTRLFVSVVPDKNGHSKQERWKFMGLSQFWMVYNGTSENTMQGIVLTFPPPSLWNGHYCMNLFL